LKKVALIMAGMAGAGLTAYMIMNKKARKQASKMLDSMLDEAGNMMDKSK
jgi:hypothetical protein